MSCSPQASLMVPLVATLYPVLLWSLLLMGWHFQNVMKVEAFNLLWLAFPPTPYKSLEIPGCHYFIPFYQVVFHGILP